MKETVRKTVLLWLQILPLIAVGGWTVFTFHREQRSALAEAQARLAKLEVEQKERHARENLIRAYVEGRSLIRTAEGWTIVGALRFTNKGGSEYDLALTPQCLRLSRVDFHADPEGNRLPVLLDCQRTDLLTAPKTAGEDSPGSVRRLRIRPGADQEFCCFFRVEKPGLYLLDFKTDYATADGSNHTVLLAHAYFPVGVAMTPITPSEPAKVRPVGAEPPARPAPAEGPNDETPR